MMVSVSVSDWLLAMASSFVEQVTLFSVVNMPLTSRYAHSVITRDCCCGETAIGQPLISSHMKSKHLTNRL